MKATNVLAATLLLSALALPLAACWPGIMTWDSAREYGMALRDPIDDWHPPVLIWLWRQLLWIAPGPGLFYAPSRRIRPMMLVSIPVPL